MAFTFFFRDSHTLEQAIRYLTPQVNNLKQVRVWDAGCAMGPEPYTFAILLSEKMGYFAFKRVHIDASDIDETNSFGNIVKNGEYPENELERIPRDIFNKYFTKTNNDSRYKIIDQILNRLAFHKHDLLSLKPFAGDYNLIICKNVLLHFQPEQRVEVIRMFHDCLAENGILVTEQTQPMPDANKHLFKQIAPDANVFQKI